MAVSTDSLLQEKQSIVKRNDELKYIATFQVHESLMKLTVRSQKLEMVQNCINVSQLLKS